MCTLESSKDSVHGNAKGTYYALHAMQVYATRTEQACEMV